MIPWALERVVKASVLPWDVVYACYGHGIALFSLHAVIVRLLVVQCDVRWLDVVGDECRVVL